MMSPAQMKAALAAFEKEVGPKADTYCYITTGGHEGSVALTLYPEGISGRSAAFTIYGETFEQILSEARTKWAEHAIEHEKQRIRAMALRIIEITAAIGHCTDAALRADKFTVEEVERYSARACEDANDIAGRGPFLVISAGKGNGAPIEAPAGTMLS